jgi:hypothetical protein
MTDKTIQKILNRINRGAREIITTQIGMNVWWGFAWGGGIRGYWLNGVETEGNEMFFIKAPDGKFGAAILRMGPHEMHWYVTPRYRRMGLLIEPVKKTVLPFIFSHHGVQQQSGSVELGRQFAEASVKVAERTGMHEVERTDEKVVYRIEHGQAEAFRRFSFPTGTAEELEQLRNEALVKYRALRMVFDQVRVRYVAHMKPEKVDCIINKLEDKKLDLIDIIEDAKWSIKAEAEDGGGVNPRFNS